MLGGRTSEQWIAQYASSHTHPVNRFCHSLGIPLIVVSLALAVAAIFYHPLWMVAAGLFVFGWLLQFVGHAFEHKEPEFFHDWRFLLVGVRWWWAKCADERNPNTCAAPPYLGGGFYFRSESIKDDPLADAFKPAFAKL